jgi:hypothetical protein
MEVAQVLLDKYYRAMLNQHTRAWENGERIWLQMDLHPVSLLITLGVLL